MRITLLSVNTYADVQHMFEIGRCLKGRGHDVSFCAGLFLREAIEDHGMKYCRIPLEIDSVVQEYEDRGEFEYLKRKNFDGHRFLRKKLKFKYRQLLNYFFMACKDAHLIVYDSSTIGAPDIAEFFGIPCVHVAMLPNVSPISEYPCDDFSNKFILNYPFNKLTYRKIIKSEKDVIGIINDFRVTALSLPPRKMGKNYYKINKWEIPIIYSFPKVLFENVKTFREKVHVTGLNTSDMKKPLSKEMYAFLNSGDAPILVNFGMMPLEDAEVFLEKLINAMYEVKCRFIFVVGETHMSLPNNPDILLISHTRKEGLLSRCKGFIHYGELLNITDGFYYNVPQLIFPQTTEQKFWAKFLYSKGLTFKPLVEEKATTKVLIDALNAFDDPTIKDKLTELYPQIKAEKGLLESAKIIENTLLDYLDFYKDKEHIGMKRLGNYEIGLDGKLKVKKKD